MNILIQSLTNFDSYLKTNFDSYLMTNFDSYLMTNFDSFLMTNFDSYLLTNFDSYLMTNFDSYLMTIFDSYLMTNFDSYLMTNFDSFLMTNFDSYLMTNFDSYLMTNFDSFLMTNFDSYLMTNYVSETPNVCKNFPYCVLPTEKCTTFFKYTLYPQLKDQRRPSIILFCGTTLYIRKIKFRVIVSEVSSFVGNFPDKIFSNYQLMTHNVATYIGLILILEDCLLIKIQGKVLIGKHSNTFGKNPD